MIDVQQTPTAEVIQEWLVAHLATALELPQNQIDIRESFDRYGLDSLAAVTLTGALEEWLNTELPPTLAWDYPNIEELSQYLAELVAEQA